MSCARAYVNQGVAILTPNTQLDPQSCLSNVTSKVLQCIRTMHELTEFDLMEGKHYEKVFLGLQRTSRELWTAARTAGCRALQWTCSGGSQPGRR